MGKIVHVIFINVLGVYIEYANELSNIETRCSNIFSE